MYAKECRSFSTFVRQSLQDVEEDHDDVSVKNDCPQYVVIDFDLIAFASHYQLSVDDQVDAVDQNSYANVECVHLSVRENEEEDQTEHQ